MRHFIVLICFLEILNSHSQTKDHFKPEYFEQQVFAHRGGYANGPENTIQTFLFNLNKGITAFEVDVMMTKDKQLVLFHDETIQKVLNTDKPRKLSELTVAELKKIPLRDQSQGVQYVTTLKELVDTLAVLISKKDKKDFLLELDFKPNGELGKVAIQKLLQIISAKTEIYGDALYNYFFVSTFYPDVLKELKKYNTKIKTAFAVHNNPNKNKLLAKLAILFAPKIIKKNQVSIIEPNHCMLTDRFVKKYHKKGIMINTYTVNTSCEKEYVKKWCIAYTSNCPSSLCSYDDSGQKVKRKKWCKRCRSRY